MKKLTSPSKEEFRQFEYEFNQTKDDLPPETVEVMELSFNLLRQHFTCELPLRGELASLIEKFMYDHYLALRVFTKKWQKDWIKEVAVKNADNLGFCISNLFTSIETGKALPMYDDFENMIQRYAKPKQPDIVTIADYAEHNLSEEQKGLLQETLEEANQVEIEDCEVENRLKKEYLNVVQPIVFNYFGHLTEDMTLEMWNHYGVELGKSYMQFREYCFDLLYVLIKKNLTKFPEMGFFEYRNKRLTV